MRASTSTCPGCGAELPTRALDGLCPKCAVKLLCGETPPTSSFQSGPKTRAFPVEALPLPRAQSTRTSSLGDYNLLEEIARGGMGVVYKAHQVSLNRVVAVKVILSGAFASEQFKQRFQMEARAAANLRHPNIVPVHETGEQDGFHYFSMDYIEGQSLAELVREKPLPARRAARYVKIIAEAIAYAHQKGIFHRDLKPSNVLIDSSDQPQLTDFGLAKITNAQSELTVTGQMLGSPNYLPPEQAIGSWEKVGAQSDVYSLGAILYHLIAGRPPFLAQTLQDTLAHVVNKEPVSPHLLNPTIPPDLNTICLKCMEKEPSRRYQSAQALADELDRFLADKPILARPTSRPEKLWRWCRREPLTAALVTAASLALALGIAGILWQWRRAEEKSAVARAYNYISDMSVAFRDPEIEPAQVYDILQKHIPRRGETDLRGFEWRYLWGMLRGNYASTLPEHKQVVGAMSFSAKGRLLATYAWNDTLRVWDVHSRHNPLTITNATALGAFRGKGEIFVAATHDGSIKLFQTYTGKILKSVAGVGEIVAFSADGSTAVGIDLHDTLTIWDIPSFTARLRITNAIPRRSDYNWAAALAISPAGNFLASVQSPAASHEHAIALRLWDLRTGAELPPLPDSRQVRSVLFSPDEKTLAAGAGDGTITLWNLAAGGIKNFQAHTLPVISLAFSPDGQSLASGSSDQAIKRWSVSTGEPLAGKFHGQVGDVWSLAWSPDGKTLASGSRNTTIKFWDANPPDIPDHAERLLAEDWGNFTFCPDSKLMAAGCQGNVVKIWDVNTFALVATLRGASYAVAFSPDGAFLLTSTAEEIPQWWDVHAKTSRPNPRYEGSVRSRVLSVDISPDRQVAALGHKDGAIELIEIASGHSTSWQGHSAKILSIAWSPDGTKLITGSSDRSVAMWDVATHKKIASSGEHRGGVCAVAFSHSGKLFASGCGANTIKFWKTANVMDKSLGSLSSHESAIRTLAFSPDEKTLASGSEDNTVKLWNVAYQTEIGGFKCDSHVRLVAFSPDGNNLAIVTDHGTLTLLRAPPVK
jgi:WD40 repeat protein/predicted Ser/Thr protein kinase